MTAIGPEYRSPDLSQYRLSDEYDIRCPKCRASSNCITSTWQRGHIDLKCICGWTKELFIDVRGKVDKTAQNPSAVVTSAAPAAPPVAETIIKRCRKCRSTFEIPIGAKGLYCEPCRTKLGLPPRSYTTGDTQCPTN